jgi:hypothetical protein
MIENNVIIISTPVDLGTRVSSETDKGILNTGNAGGVMTDADLEWIYLKKRKKYLDSNGKNEIINQYFLLRREHG